MSTALIFGVTGQDGSYLAELLIHVGYEVHGVVRRASTFNTGRIDSLIHRTDPHIGSSGQKPLQLHYGDVLDPHSVAGVITKLKPQIVFNLAAQSHVQVSFEIPDYTYQTNFIGVQNILEAIKRYSPSSRFYQASTSELFGNAPHPQGLETKFDPQSPYALSKEGAHRLVNFYRQAYGIWAVSGILFNHESFRRGNSFVTKKIISEANRISNALAKGLPTSEITPLRLGNLDAVRDWGWAPEYMLAVLQTMSLHDPIQTVVGTGISATVRDFAERSFGNFAMNAHDWIAVDSFYARVAEVNFLQANNSSMKAALGWTPTYDWKKVCDLMSAQEVAGRDEVDWSKLMTDHGITKDKLLVR